MKIAKRDIAIVMIVVSLLALFCAYKFSLQGNLSAVEDEKAKQSTLQTQIDEVKARAIEVNKMDKEIAQWQVNIADWIKPFHANYLYEDGLMYLNNLEKQAEKEGEGKFGVRIDKYTVGESMVSSTVSGQGSFAGTTYIAGTTAYTYHYKITGYKELKNMINYIVNEEDGSGVKTLDSIVIGANTDGGLFEGDITMTAYSITDGTNEYVPQDLKTVEQKIKNNSIFGEISDSEQKNQE